MSTLQPAPTTRPANTGSLVYSDNETAQWIYMIGDCIAIPYGGEETGGRFEFMLVEAHPGGGPPLHTHAEAEAFVILDGEFEFTSYVNGALTSITAAPADGLLVPGGVPHTFKCVSAGGGHCIAFILPSGREQFFHEAGVYVTPETRAAVVAAPPDLARIMAAAQRHGLGLWNQDVQAWDGASAQYFPADAARSTTRRIAGEVFHVALEAEHANGGLLVADSSSQPGAMVPMHCHHQPEVFYCAAGEYQFGTLDGDGQEVWFSLPAGASVFIPPNAPHAFRNPSDEPARCLAFFNGTDVRGFFQLGQPVADREAAARTPFVLNPAELGVLVAEAGKHGMKF